ncbi:sigma-70 family RNA polymerase sigma factor [Caulobacter sp. SL161]|uniref:RNA polymerase sigma factor n=1 Tax=Caulobacter sp. SL161 TaxID=2995156 RepID=UPI002274161E|nr:sigma-70 family RNA polymerase sigma factor [Caulobacter sp. SL161]MCY1647981.1 sigma-70 family RNA polymerase sigma factor [Caulobacter sp. SL161]
MEAPPDFRNVVEAHGAMLQRIAAAYEANPALREELSQEILLAVWRALPAWRGEASTRTFVARIAHNRAVDHVARQAGRPRSAALDEAWPSPAPSPLEDLERSDMQARLVAAVRRLPLPLRQVTIQTLEGFTPAEIAEVLGVNANTVSIRLTRAKAALKIEMETDR